MRYWLLALLLSGAACVSCKKDPASGPAPSPSSSSSLREAFPVPNDLAFNPLVGAGEATPGGSSDPMSDAPGAGAPGRRQGGPAEAPRKATLTQPGAEPRAKLVYDFALGKPETLVALFKTSAREESAGRPPQGGEQPPVRFTLVVTGRGRAPDGRVQFAMSIAKAEIGPVSGAPLPQEVKDQIDLVTSALAKVGGSFTVDPHGALGDLSFAIGEDAPPALSEFAPLLQQVVELLFMVIPEEPVGIGAQWTSNSSSAEGNGALAATYTLKERSPTGAVLRVDTRRTMPPQRVPDPRVPPGSTMEMKGKGSYTASLRFGGPASKGGGDTETRIVIKDSSTTPPRVVTSVLKVTQTIESGGAAASAPLPDGSAKGQSPKK